MKYPEEKENLITDHLYETIAKKLITEIKDHMVNTNDLLKIPEPDITFENFMKQYLQRVQKSEEDD